MNYRNGQRPVQIKPNGKIKTMKAIKNNKPVDQNQQQQSQERRIQFDEISKEALINVIEARLANANYHYKRKRGKSKKQQWAEMSIYGSILLNLKRQDDGSKN